MRISVCIATYNGAKYIKEQIDSILLQLGDDDEIIISDDCSTDDTIQILKAYHDSRIKIFIHDKQPQKYPFAYASKNFENALKQAKGAFIFLADQDDVWLPGKVEKMLYYLRNADLVMSDCSLVNENLEVFIPSKFKLEKVKIGVLRNIWKSNYVGSCMAFRRQALKYILPIRKNVPHDLWIGIVVGIKGKFVLLDEVTMLYRRHNDNVSANRGIIQSQQKKLPKNKNSFLFKMRFRLSVLIALVGWLIKYKR